MTPKKKKQRRGGDPANLEKSRERTKKHLVPGKKPEQRLTIPQLEYCAWRARGASIADAGRLAGIRPGSIHKFEHRELTQKTIEEFTEEQKDRVVASVNEISRAVRMTSATALVHAIRNWKTHPKRGDDARAKVIETGCKVGGLIRPPQHINQATAAAFAAAQTDVGSKVIIEYIGRPQDQEAAQASIGGKGLP